MNDKERKIYMKQYRFDNKEKIKQVNKKYRNTKKGIESVKKSYKKYILSTHGKYIYKKTISKYSKSDKGKLTHQKYRKNNLKKIKSRRLINYLFKTTDFIRDNCCICGKPNAEFHHENYELPYFGYWFCKKHHTQIHGV